jgi:catechol 2,3-dioxygenase-like lactoylglutathione lyase family enzyme
MSPADPAAASPGTGAFHHVTVGVADLAVAMDFWQRAFGFVVRGQRAGPDAALGALWDLPAARIRRQALLATQGASAGARHLVEFVDPDPPVRRGAGVTDRLPKSLDLYARDLPARHAELVAAGFRFRGPPTLMADADPPFREAHLAGHDDLNVVLLEVLAPGYDLPRAPLAVAGLGPVVTIVADRAAEAAFYREALGLATTLELVIGGPAIEQAVGLPPGAGLDIAVFGDPAEPLGRIEVIEYQRVAGADRYPRARPPACGLLHATWRVADLAPLRARLAAAGVATTDHGFVDALFGAGELVACRSPAGFRVELQAAG